MNAIRAIAANTVREAVRDKVLYLLLFFAALIIVGSEALAVLAIGDERKVIYDLGLSAISLASALIAAFLGLSMVAREIDRRTVYSIVSKPISRGQFLAGKFAGLFATVLLLSAAMTVIFIGFVRLRLGEFLPGIFLAVLLFMFEALVLAAFAVLFSSFTTPILGTLFTLTIYAIGHVSFGLKQLAAMEGVRQTVWSKLLLGLYYLLPNLERFNVKGAVVYGDPLPEGLLLPIGYGLVYTVAVALIAVEIFERRDFI